jgi:hypothetical protein
VVTGAVAVVAVVVTGAVAVVAVVVTGAVVVVVDESAVEEAGSAVADLVTLLDSEEAA